MTSPSRRYLAVGKGTPPARGRADKTLPGHTEGQAPTWSRTPPAGGYRILPPAPARQFGGKTRAQRGQLGAEPRPGPAAGHDQPARGPLWITRGQPCAYPTAGTFAQTNPGGSVRHADPGRLAGRRRRAGTGVLCAREPSRSRLWDLSCPLAPPSDGGQRAVIDHNRGAREPGWCASSATSCDDRLRHGWARSGEADVQDEVPEPELEYSAAGPVHDERQQDDGQDYDDHPRRGTRQCWGWHTRRPLSL